MKPPTPHPWEDFFSGTRRVVLPMRLLMRHGAPFLLLPEDRQAALATLGLYPAQSGLGVWFRRLVQAALRLGLARWLPEASLALDPASAFVRCLSEVSRTSNDIPVFGALAGNPRAQGRRCLFLVFGSQSRPVAVVKAGATGTAIELVNREADFLERVPHNQTTIPRLVSRFHEKYVSAFAIPYAAGRPGTPGDLTLLEPILTSWLSPEPRPLASIPEWRQVQAYIPDLPPANLEVCSALTHGDFAPWNVRVRAAMATVLDWERGNNIGVPLWDWLHYVIQPELLVRGTPPCEINAKVQKGLRTSQMAEYVRKSRIGGLEPVLTRAYLIHMIESVRPSEGLEGLRGCLAEF